MGLHVILQKGLEVMMRHREPLKLKTGCLYADRAVALSVMSESLLKIDTGDLSSALIGCTRDLVPSSTGGPWGEDVRVPRAQM